MTIIKHVIVVAVALIAWKFYEKNFVISSTKPRVEGYFHPSFRNVAETFRKNVESGLEKGASFAVYYKGEPLVDMWGGWADLAAERHWQENTLCMTWSVIKGATAIAIAHLVDMGHLDYQKRVAHYWPEFGCNGKENITVEGLLSHTVGLLGLDKTITLLEYKHNWSEIEKLLASQTPKWTPGTAVGYHGITYGMYMDALVRKVDPKHRNISQFFQEEIANAIGIELHIGIPLHQYYRFARVHQTSIWEGRVDVIGAFFTLINPYYKLASAAWDINDQYVRLNNPDILSVGMASSNGVGTARAVAKMYDFIANNGSVGSKKLLSSSAVKALSEPLSLGLPNVFAAENPFSRGLILRNVEDHLHVGHSGLAGNYAWADMTASVGIAYLTNHLTMYLQDDPRQVSLRQAFVESFAKYKADLQSKSQKQKKVAEDRNT